MGTDRAHAGRLADDRAERLAAKFRQACDHVWYAAAACLLIIGQGEVQRPTQLHCRKLRNGCENGRKETLHVGGAAAIEPVRLDAKAEGIARPAGLRRRNDVHMAGDNIATRLFWPDGGEDVGPIALRTGKDIHCDAVAFQIAADPGHDVVVR